MIFSKKYFISLSVLHAPSGVTTKTPHIFMLFNDSLSHNKKPVTCTAVADCGFYSKDRMFSVTCELKVM